jgi:hypothetical protein
MTDEETIEALEADLESATGVNINLSKRITTLEAALRDMLYAGEKLTRAYGSKDVEKGMDAVCAFVKAHNKADRALTQTEDLRLPRGVFKTNLTQTEETPDEPE